MCLGYLIFVTWRYGIHEVIGHGWLHSQVTSMHCQHDWMQHISLLRRELVTHDCTWVPGYKCIDLWFQCDYHIPVSPILIRSQPLAEIEFPYWFLWDCKQQISGNVINSSGGCFSPGISSLQLCKVLQRTRHPGHHVPSLYLDPTKTCQDFCLSHWPPSQLFCWEICYTLYHGLR